MAWSMFAVMPAILTTGLTRGATGWSFADVQPYFKRMENAEFGEPDWRGKNGPLHVSRGERKNPLYDAFIEAGAQAGFERTDDYNGQKQEGFGAFEQTIHNGRQMVDGQCLFAPGIEAGKCQSC